MENKNFMERFLELRNEIGPLFKNSEMEIKGKKLSYVDLASIRSIVNPLCLKHKILISISRGETNVERPNEIPFLCEIFDATTEQLKISHNYSFPMAESFELIKAVGSTQTYAERYILGTELCLISELDPDAIPVKENTKNVQQQQQQGKGANEPKLQPMPNDVKRQILEAIENALDYEDLEKVVKRIAATKNKYTFDVEALDAIINKKAESLNK